MRLEIDLDLLADEVASRVAARLADRLVSQVPSPWMAMEEAIAYTRIPAGTTRFHLTPRVEALERRAPYAVVALMCAFAERVQAGELPGP